MRFSTSERRNRNIVAAILNLVHKRVCPAAFAHEIVELTFEVVDTFKPFTGVPLILLRLKGWYGDFVGDLIGDIF